MDVMQSREAAMHHDARRRVLEARLEELRARLVRIEEELDQPHDPDFSDQAIEREDEEVLERFGRSGQAEIVQIERALKRIDDGSYGVCASCGEAISEERLDLLPFTPVCRACAK